MDAHKILQYHFGSYPEKMLEWLKTFGQVEYKGDSDQIRNVAVTANLEDWVRAGASINAQGDISLKAPPSLEYLSIPSLPTELERAAEKHFLVTGSLPKDLPEETTLEILHSRAQRIQEYQERIRKEFLQAEERKAEKIQKEKEYAEERLRWCKKFGSGRLLKAAALDLLPECDTIYVEERLHQEFPEWEVLSPKMKSSSPHNPSLLSLLFLEEARKTFGDAFLVWMVDRQEPRQGFAILATYLGREIFRWVEEVEDSDTD